MSENDQADGFFDTKKWGGCKHPECAHLEECSYALGLTEDSRRGANVTGHQKDVWDLTHGKEPFRLTKGFNMLHASER